MRKTTRKLTAVLLSAVCTLTAALPAFSCTCAAAEESAAASEAAAVKEVSFTASEKLAAMIADIESGNLNLYLDNERKKPAGLALDDREDNNARYYAFTNSGVSTFGKQCYIYSQAVYATLFDELPLHGVDPKAPYKYSEQAAGFAETLTPEFLTANGVMPGAYFRTTVNTDGSYSSKGGHSMIILGYNRDSVRILEGNGDGNGLIRDVLLTYEQFNRIYITRKGRFVGNIIQPTAAYYKSHFGLAFEDFPDAPPDEPMPNGGFMMIPETPSSESEDKAVPEPESEPGDTDEAEANAADAEDTAAAGPKPERGDVDADGRVTAYDASLALIGFTETQLLEYAPEERTLTAEQEQIGDADGDGTLTAYDASLILTYFTLKYNAGFDDLTWEEILPA